MVKKQLKVDTTLDFDLPKRKFKTIYDPSLPEVSLEKSGGKSHTLPEMSLSIKQILNKYAAGIDPMVKQNPEYENEPDIDNPNPFNTSIDPLTDREELQIEFEYWQGLANARKAKIDELDKEGGSKETTPEPKGGPKETPPEPAAP